MATRLGSPLPAVRALPEVLRGVILQVVYDEGPLYIFSPTEELRKRWIHQLKSGECGGSAAPWGSQHGCSAVPVPAPHCQAARGSLAHGYHPARWTLPPSAAVQLPWLSSLPSHEPAPK